MSEPSDYNQSCENSFDCPSEKSIKRENSPVNQTSSPLLSIPVNQINENDQNSNLNRSKISNTSAQSKKKDNKNKKLKLKQLGDKYRCQSISNTTDKQNALPELERWKIRIQFNQDIINNRNNILQNESSPEFNQIKRIVTLQKIRRPKSPTFTNSPKSSQLFNSKTKMVIQASGVKQENQERNVKDYNNSQTLIHENNFQQAQQQDLSIDADQFQKLNKSDIVYTNRGGAGSDHLNIQNTEGVYLSPSQMQTRQKFLLRQIYQQQVRAHKSMSRVKTQLEKNRRIYQQSAIIDSPISSSSQLLEKQASLPLQRIQLQSVNNINNNDTSIKDIFPNQTLSPSITTLQNNYKCNHPQQKIKKILYPLIMSSNNNQTNKFNNNMSLKNKSMNYQQQYQSHSQNRIQDQLNQTQQISKTITNDSQVNYHSNIDLNKNNYPTQINQNYSSPYLQNLTNKDIQDSQQNQNIQQTIKQPIQKIEQPKYQIIENINNNIPQNTNSSIMLNINQEEEISPIRTITQNKSRLKNNRLQILINPQNETKDKLQSFVSDISPIQNNHINKQVQSPLSQIGQYKEGQNPFIPYHKVPNIQKYLFSDEQETPQNISLQQQQYTKKPQQSQQQNDIINKVQQSNIYNRIYSKQQQLNSKNNNQSKQLSSMRKHIVYDQEFYESEIKAIDMSNKEKNKNQGNKECINIIDKALPFTNSIIKDKIKQLINKGSFINPLTNFSSKITVVTNHQLQHRIQDKKNIHQNNIESKKVVPQIIKTDIDKNGKRIIRNINRNNHKSLIYNEILNEISYESRNPSFINSSPLKSKQYQTHFENHRNEGFVIEPCSQIKEQEIIEENEDTQINIMKNNLKRYIDQRNRTPLHQNFNNNKKILYKNHTQMRLDTI